MYSCGIEPAVAMLRPNTGRLGRTVTERSDGVSAGRHCSDRRRHGRTPAPAAAAAAAAGPAAAADVGPAVRVGTGDV